MLFLALSQWTTYLCKRRFAVRIINDENRCLDLKQTRSIVVVRGEESKASIPLLYGYGRQNKHGSNTMNNLSAFNRLTGDLKEQESIMPVLFIGHGSPMNGIEDNEFSQRWKAMAKEIPVPKAVLVISAHWLSKGTRITAMDFPKTIHDFRGFPEELFNVQYPAPGDAQLASETKSLIKSTEVELDHD